MSLDYEDKVEFSQDYLHWMIQVYILFQDKAH